MSPNPKDQGVFPVFFVKKPSFIPFFIIHLWVRKNRFHAICLTLSDKESFFPGKSCFF